MNKLLVFKKFTFITIVAVYLLILIGASVRASGSGMGCPDWPTCFGQLIPPTSESQLPDNYRELYAPKLANGQTLEPFNAKKTWTEYFNRLFGILVGIISLGLFAFSFLLKKDYPKLFYISFTIFVLICLQGVLGAVVVATNLLPGMISAHMLMALLILCLLIYLKFSIQQLQISPSHAVDTYYESNISLPHLKSLYYLIAIILALMLIQMLMGTQVREMIDFASKATNTRTNWLSLLGDIFYVHRSFSWVIILINITLLWLLYKYPPRKILVTFQLIALIMIVLQITSGSLLNHFSFPMVVQPFHLLSSTIILGIQFNMLCHIHRYYKYKTLTSSFQ